jgi:hypothetical protein
MHKKNKKTALEEENNVESWHYGSIRESILSNMNMFWCLRRFKSKARARIVFNKLVHSALPLKKNGSKNYCCCYLNYYLKKD